MNKKNATTLLLFAFLLTGCGAEHWTQATIVQKVYTPASTGVGPVAAGKGGGIAVVITDDTYVLLLRFDDGSVKAFPVYSSDYVQYREGERVKVGWRWYGFTHIDHATNH